MSVASAIQPSSDTPEERYRRRQDFYRKYGFAESEFGYGESELAFMEWEIKRGVLNAPDSDRPGSPWWRAVNLAIAIDSEQAAAIHEQGDGADARDPIRFWLDYFKSPSPRTWYRAHNASITRAYMQHCAEAEDENEAEQEFVNIVLYRLLYAHALVEGRELPWLGPLGKFLANPLLPGVEFIVDLPEFYPSEYPLTHEVGTLDERHWPEALAADVFDLALIGPHLRKLYASAARRLRFPELKSMLINGQLSYPSLEAKPGFPLRIWRFLKSLFHLLQGGARR